jgi:hypothetical protein
MSKRYRIPATEEEAAELPLAELNQYITNLEYRAKYLKLSASLKKSTLKLLVWLKRSTEFPRQSERGSRRPACRDACYCSSGGLVCRN